MTDVVPDAGEVRELETGLRRILAPNPSPMTHWGTNTYLVGTGPDTCVLDPGPEDTSHLDAILLAAGGARISHIVITHSHVDHSPLARRLAERTGAEIAAFGPSSFGRSAVMQALADAGLGSGGESVDNRFVPHRRLADGDVISGNGWSMEAIHTPGHMGNHLCFAYGDAILTGDHVMAWASSLVSPPDGDMTDFMASCARLALRLARRHYPGHGGPINAPLDRLDWLMAHRREREAQILAALEIAAEPCTAGQIARRVYTDIPSELCAAAERNAFAHLIDLAMKGVIATEDALAIDSAFSAL